MSWREIAADQHWPHISVTLPPEMFAKLEADRGRHTRSGYIRYVLKLWFEALEKQKADAA